MDDWGHGWRGKMPVCKLKPMNARVRARRPGHAETAGVRGCGRVCSPMKVIDSRGRRVVITSPW